jgi:hypothetical protein
MNSIKRGDLCHQILKKLLNQLTRRPSKQTRAMLNSCNTVPGVATSILLSIQTSESLQPAQNVAVKVIPNILNWKIEQSIHIS